MDGKEKKIGAAEPILTPIDILDGPYSAVSTPILPTMLQVTMFALESFLSGN